MAAARRIRTAEGPGVNRTDGRRIVGPLDPRALGNAAHQVVQDALLDGVRTAEARIVTVFVARHPFLQLAPSYRRSSFARLTQALSTYMRFFVPRDDWTLLGCEVDLGYHIADVVWRDPAGRVILDELKTERSMARYPSAARRQVEALATAGRERYGDEFGGVRYLPLRAPGLAQWHGSDGISEALRIDDSHAA